MAVTVIGFEKNGLFINNPILLDLTFEPSGGEGNLYFTIRVTNASTTENSGIIKISPKNYANTARIDISPLLKSMFRNPDNNTNYTNISEESSSRAVFNFQITANYIVSGIPGSQTTTINNRSFFRGGYRANLENHNANIGSYLSPVDVLPYWNGYPIASYKVGENFEIIKNPDISGVVAKELRIKPACNNYYVKFLNSLGGYSYWLFQGLTESKSTTNLGYSNVFNRVNDFGNTIKRNVTLYSKVPKRFYPLMEDLADSRNVYLFNYSNMAWYPIINENNKTERNDYKKNYEVKFNFELVTNYNPSAW